MNPILQFFRNLGAVRLAVLGGVAVALIAFLFFLTSRLASPSMQLLYSGLEPADSREVVNYLSQTGARFDLRGQNGSDIYVPGDQINSLRMALAQQGLPTEGSMGYEIFDKSDGFGTTNFVLNNELTYADKKLRGRRFWSGLRSFYLVCSFGTLANVSVASVVYEANLANFFFAGIAGAVMSVVFNYSVTRMFTWR